jgi:Uma2 family endonuclease
LLFCSENGTELGWLIDPEAEMILGIFSEQKVKIFSGQEDLPILGDIALQLKADDVFGWLRLD